jgi:phosphoribosyl-ATP pyrophosphohydrolase/phosphoribosyl-AMP cyclohydrolase/histidinol dehydrogenase
MTLLRRITPAEVEVRRSRAVDPETLAAAAVIVSDVRGRGEKALREHAVRLGDMREGEPLVYGPEELAAALREIPPVTRALLERTRDRIRAFAEAQRACLRELDVAVPGGRAGHTIAPVERAGCYAPGGRFPLPSSVLMTVVTARAAGVPTVWVASPRPTAVTLAAAAIAGADALLAVGGAQAIAALAYGVEPVPSCDVIVGPGNRWVTAAKKVVSGDVSIEFLAGPSELVVVADDQADPECVAADLLAQAEHDPDALPVLIAPSDSFADAVERALQDQLPDLSTKDTASRAVSGGFAVVAPNLEAAFELCDRLAPEHLELLVADPIAAAKRVHHYGALFLGPRSAEVLADYGVGPNHVLPTGGMARSTGGLSVLHFLRVRTWLSLEGEASVAEDAAILARLEGLEAHARAAERRLIPR